MSFYEYFLDETSCEHLERGRRQRPPDMSVLLPLLAVLSGAGGPNPAPTKAAAFTRAVDMSSNLPVVVLARPFDGARRVACTPAVRLR
eukprot:scaffold5911_cov127-Isochrysis_galbana.AAC.2